MSVWCLGNLNIKIPHIDQMAREGIRFTQALAGMSVCAPTRCCLMTGKHSGHTSVRSNGGGTPLRAGEETIASVEEVLETMMPGGGYALSPTHMLQDNSPTENVLAVYETALDKGRYS